MPETPAGYRVAELGALSHVPFEDGWWRPIRRELGVTTFGVNGYGADGTNETANGAVGRDE